MEEKLVGIFAMMCLIRKFEEKALALFEADRLRGSVHLCIGQEAIPAAVCAALGDRDTITSTHRGHGHCLARGGDPKRAMAELMGRADGYCKGRGGSMHIADFTKGNLGANAIVGAGLPIATGAGLSAKMLKEDRVSVAFFGDGASNQGAAHEAMNLASVWKLPVVFVCENNGFGISVPVKQSTSVKDISARAAAYGIPGITVDGNDALAVLEAATKAVDRARKGEGPSLIECKTYRWLGHWTGDPQVYRTREEVEAWKKKCPIKRLRKTLLDKKLATADELDEIEREAARRIEEAGEFALASPEPDPERVMDDVFFEGEGGAL